MSRFLVVLGALCSLVACGAKTKTSADAGTPPAPITLTLKAGCNPFAVTSECAYPFPSAWFQNADSTASTGFRVAYPKGIFGASSSGITIDVAPYNTADGVPPVSPIVLYFGADVDLTNLPDLHHEGSSVLPTSPIALIDLVDGTRVPFFAEMDQNRSAMYPNRYAFILRPAAGMEMGHRHAVVITDSVTLADGSPLPVPAAFAALRDQTITTNPQIEQARAGYETMFKQFATAGYEREHIALAWDFMVASQDYLLNPILSMRTTALTMLGTTGLPYVIQTVSPTPEGGELVEGTFEAPSYINANNQFDWDANHLPTLQTTNASYPFTWYLPSATLKPGAAAVPLAVFGHGLFGTGRGYLDTDSIATAIRHVAEEANVSLVATDWIGLSGTNDDLAVGAMVATDINQLGTITDRLTQSLINNLAMTKLVHGNLQSDAMVKTDHALIDNSRTYYYGVSLGGIQGASFVSLSDDITRATLAVPGCDWSTMFPRSVDWQSFEEIAAPTYPDPLQQITILSLMQARFDFDDGANLATMLLRHPIAGNPPKTVNMQEAIGDSQVPNVVTEILARTIGVQQMTPDYVDVFGLTKTTSPAMTSTLSQYFLAFDVEGNWPPDTDVFPTSDNGAHFGMNVLPNVQEQIINFVGTGVINQYCQDVCTPY